MNRLTALIYAPAAAELPLAGRTARAMASAGWPEPETVFPPGEPHALAARLRSAPGPVLVLRAGAWPVGSEAGNAALWPSPEAGEIVALGAARSGPAAGEWQQALRVGGGEFSRTQRRWFPWKRAPRLPAQLCVWLGFAAARTAAWELENGCPSWEAAVGRLAERENFRVVRWLDLDVRHDSSLRVLEVITTLQRGGAERVTLDLAAELNRQGVACAVAALAAPGRNAYPEPSAFFDLSDAPNTPDDRAAAVHRAAVAFGADVVHAHLLKGSEARAVKARGLPLALTVHNERPGWPPGLADLGPDDADLLLGCAAAITRALPATVPARTLSNGITAGAFAPTPARIAAAAALRRAWAFGEDDFVLLALANPRPQKRLERLPAILAATRARLRAASAARSVRLVLAGSGSRHCAAGDAATAELEGEIARWRVAADVRRPGDVEDVPALLAAVNVLVSPSAHEGLSLAWLEALAAGRPVVSTAVGGAAEVAARTAHGMFQMLPPDAPAEAWGEVLAGLALSPRPGAADAITLPKDHALAAMARRARVLLPRAVARARSRVGRKFPAAGVWLVTNNFSCGGAQSSARRLLLALAAAGLPVRATVVQEEPNAPTRGRLALAASGVPVHAAMPDPLDPARTVAAILQPLDADPPSAVLFWNLLPSVRVALADALLDTPIFDVSPGEMSFDSLDAFFTQPRTGLPYANPRDYGERLAGAVVKYRGEVARASAMLGCPVHVIPNGVSLPELPSRPPGASLRLGTAARLSPDKRLEDLLAALRLAHRELPRGYRLEIAGGTEPGKDAYGRELRRLARGLPVRWLGRVEDMAGFLRGLDIFTMISRPAGCPNASLEGMAAGRPVVATDWGGASEQIVDGETGRLVPDGDAPALAAALVELARDPAARERFGRAGRERARELFSIERMTDAYVELCQPGPVPAVRPDHRASPSAAAARREIAGQ